MSRSSAIHILVLAAAFGSEALAARGDLPETWMDGVEWRPEPLHPSVGLDELKPAPPFVSSPRREGEVEVGPSKGAAFYLAPLDVVRVRAPSELRFTRIPRAVTPGAPALRVDEKGIPARDGDWYLTEPIGAGSVWWVSAPSPTRITVERPSPLRGDSVDEETHRAILAWVQGKGRMPGLPFDAELRARLELDAETGRSLLSQRPEDQRLSRAVQEWRLASARVAWALSRSLDTPSFRVDTVGVPGPEVKLEPEPRAYRRLDGGQGRDRTVALQLSGPGVLELEARLLFDERDDAGRLDVVGSGQRLATLLLPARVALRPEDDDTATYPDRTPRVLPTGERVGLRQLVRIPLNAGRGTYLVRLSGGTALLRARVARPRPSLGEVLRGDGTWRSAVNRALEALQGHTIAEAALLRRELSRIDTAVPWPQEVSTEGLSPLLRALALIQQAERTDTRDARARAAEEAAKALAALGEDRPTALMTWLTLRAARLLAESSELSQAQRLLTQLGTFPESGWLTAELADVIALLPLGHPLRSRQLAAYELAFRREPLATGIRERYAHAFSARSRWAAVSPLPLDGRLVPMPKRWLDRQPLEKGALPPEGAFWPLRANEPVTVRSTGAADRPTVLRAFVLANGATEPLALRVGDRRVNVAPIAAVEPVEIALPPGPHSVELLGPSGVMAFYSLEPVGSGTPTEVAYLRTGWPSKLGGDAVHFRVPDAQLASPVRFQLRPMDVLKAPLEVRLHTDVGPVTWMWLSPSGASEASLSLDGRSAPSPVGVSVVVALPPFAREVWLESDQPLWVSLSVRREALTSDWSAKLARIGAEPSADAVLELSQKLQETPDRPELLLARAELLASMGETYLARADMVRLLRSRVPVGLEMAQRLDALLRSFDDDAAAQLVLPGPIDKPLVLLPGAAALDAAELRTALKDSSGDSPSARYVHARRLALGGKAEDAALGLAGVYRELDAPQLGLEALGLLEQLPPDVAWPDRYAPVSAALAEQLLPWADAPLVRRMRELSLRWTRWDRLGEAEANAGALELFQLGRAELSHLVRKALVAPPWPLEQLRLVRRGHASVLELVVRKPNRLGAQVLCRAIGLEQVHKPCAFQLRVDGRVLARDKAKPGEVATLLADLRQPGKHQLEVSLEEGEGPMMAVIRFVEATPKGVVPLAGEEPVPVLRSRPGRPVTMTLMGPTALKLGVRAPASDGARRLKIETSPEQGKMCARAVELPAETDAAVVDGVRAVRREQETYILLPERGPHRLVIEPEGGEALVRVHAGMSESKASAPPKWWAEAPTALEPVSWPAMPPSLSLLPGGSSPTRMALLGTLSAEVGTRREDVEEGELLNRPLQTGLEMRLGYRRELLDRRLWLRLEPVVRKPFGSTTVFGTTANLHVWRLPLDVRAHASVGAFTQTVDAESRFRLLGRAWVDRWFGLSTDFGLLPSVGVTAESLPEAGGSGDRFDRWVYWRYGETHPLRVSPKLGARWQPLRDVLLTGGLRATSNSDLASVDHWSALAGWASLFELAKLPFRAELGYELSRRLHDVHRPLTYTRHGARGRLDVSVWTGRAGRLLVYVEDGLLWSGPYGMQNVAALGLRWDYTQGRGLRDFAPPEEEFESLIQR